MTATTARGTRAIASVDVIRTQFPALARRHASQPVAYFDGPGGTQVPVAVVDAMADYLYAHNANTHWNYPTSAETDAAIALARAAVADFVNARPEEISFGNNMTTITFHVARALGRGWGPGDEVVVTELDHHANIAPWRALARERGITIRDVPFDIQTGELEMDALRAALSRRTRLVAIGAASNALGTITDIAGITRLAHEVGALVYVDAVHFAAHDLIDVRTIECDFLACSAYKFYGPHAGFLYGKADVLRDLDVPRLDPAPDTIPERLETGTQNHEGIVGTAAAIDFLAGLAEGGDRRTRIAETMRTLHERGHALAHRLWEGLTSIEGVRCYGPPPDRPRTPTIAFVVEGMPSEKVAGLLADRALFLSHGDFYAATVVERLGHAADGLVRAGCACYTTEEEVDRLVLAVREIAREGM